MSEQDSAAQDVQNSDNGDRPVIELFVKAAVDKMKNGGCPICHRYFLVFYILRERGLIDLVVTTFLPENPPKEVLDFSNGKHYPLVKVHKGSDANGVDMTGVECDTVDEIEQLLDRFECDDMFGRRESKIEARAEQVFEDLYKKFNLFLKNPEGDSKPVTRILERIDEFLQENDTFFLVGDRMARADCYFLPTIQHIRVAGKAYKEYEIPTELTYLWRYLSNAYDTDAFKESCPADREIITHYDGKASSRAKLPVRRSQLMGENRTFSIPQPSATVPAAEEEPTANGNGNAPGEEVEAAAE
jgi:chloride intracellular channel protein 2